MSRRPATHGLRVTVRRDGDVVDQGTYWRWDPAGIYWAMTVILLLSSGTLWVLEGGMLTGLAVGLFWGGVVVLGLSPLCLAVALFMRWRSRSGTIDRGSIPTDDGGALAGFRWTGPDAVALDAAPVGAGRATLAAGETWSWQGAHGIRVDLDLVPLQRARRWVGGQGDVAFIAIVLTLMVGAFQLRFLQQLLVEGASGGMDSYAEPSPEYIARLLQRDLDGADEGYEERAERPEYVEGNRSFYMPSGSQGSLERSGGGEQAGEQVQRREAEEPEEPVADALDEPTPDSLLDGDLPELEPFPGEDATPERELLGEEEPPTPDEDPGAALPEAMERFVGWGFRDWFDVRDARPESERQIARHLEIVRQRLKIDPNDPGALNILGYYAYLAENGDLSKETYQRYVELYPDDPVGYNNLALTYKRSGDYEQEEALYRKALAMDPLDTHVINNLAVNLAHQGRFDEALDLMALLEELTPGDPYAELHRAKIYASMGKKNKALRSLELALDRVGELDTMHHIEFRQDLRIDPAFRALRDQPRFRKALERTYGDDAGYLTTGPDGRYMGRPRG